MPLFGRFTGQSFFRPGAKPTVFGGVLSEDATYWYRTFFGNGTLTVSGAALSADVLVVAGGGGGGNGVDQTDNGGGAGAGGLLYQSGLGLAPTAYAVTVGAGGASGGVNGSNSVISSLTAVGGGGGANHSSVGANGGSGGGGSAFNYAGGTGTSGQGNAGGAGARTGFNGGGGGGGAGGAGASGATAAGGVGVSTYSSWGLVTGTGHNVSGTVYYAGGGSGGNDAQVVAGGNGGGGFGQVYTNSTGGGAGQVNTGGGGGGGASRTANVAGGLGGSGIVIVRYPKAAVDNTTDATSYELIGTILLTSAQSSVTFAGIPASLYKHLQLRYATRSSTTYGDDVNLRFNADSGANYSHHLMVGNGSNVSAYSATSATYIKGGFTIANDQTASAFGVGVLDILDAQSTTKNKTTRNLTGGTEGGGAGNQIQLWSGAWYSTAAISSIVLTLGSGGNYLVGSRFSLYGVRG